MIYIYICFFDVWFMGEYISCSLGVVLIFLGNLGIFGSHRASTWPRFKFLMHLTPVPKASIDFLAGIGAGFAEAAMAASIFKKELGLEKREKNMAIFWGDGL